MSITTARVGSSAEEVANALKFYRTTVTEHNRLVLEWFVRDAETREATTKMGPELIAFRIREAFKIYLDGDLPESVKRPRDLLTQFDTLILPYSLDGTWDLALNDKVKQQERYLATINDALCGQAPDDFEGELSVPEEFRALVTQVDAVVGPGLPYYQQRHQIVFFPGVNEDEEQVRERILRGDDKVDQAGLDSDWEVAAGWRTGEGENGASFAVFCRSQAEEKAWQWRYKVSTTEMPFEPIHDNIANFLEWYAHYDEQNLGKLRSEIPWE